MKNKIRRSVITGLIEEIPDDIYRKYQRKIDIKDVIKEAFAQHFGQCVKIKNVRIESLKGE